MIGFIGGVFGALSAIFFVQVIHLAGSIRNFSSWWIYTLPVSGILIRFLYLRFGKGLLEAPVLAASVFLTHLGGGSAGREGAIIHLARILSTFTGKFLNFEERSARKLIITAIGSGFGASLGAPLAGLIFGFEVNSHPFLRFKTLLHSIIATLVAGFIFRWSGTPSFRLVEFSVPDYSLIVFALTVVIGILFGFITVLYHGLKQRWEQHLSRHSPLLAGFIGGGVLFTLFCVFNLKSFQGLGEEGILLAQQQTAPLATAFQKMIVTIVTLGSGFQGGEFFPLGYIGSALGSSFGFIHAASAPLYSSLGFVAVYAAATGTPIAGTLLACELFGWKILPYAACALFIANRIHQRLSFRSGQDS
jgi:H+/Cl- antiporter ClcA